MAERVRTGSGGAGAGSSRAAASGSMASSSLWAAVSQVATLGVQGIAALVILLLFGKGTDTDAVFAAYGVYGVAVLMCQTLRLTVVARLVEAPTPWPAFDRFLGAGLSLVALAVVLQLVLGGLFASVLTGDLGAAARALTRSTLDILCAAIALQLVAALGAAVLAVRSEFRFPGLAYVLGGVMAIAVLVALRGPLGIRAAPVGVAVGSALTAVMMSVRLWGLGYRPVVAGVLRGARHPRVAVMLLLGTAAPLLGQLNFVISLVFAAHLGAGAVTLYTGAFFAGAVVVAVTGSAASLVLAAPVAQTWDGDPASLLPHLRTVMRAGLIIIAPAVAVAGLVGDEVVEALLGDSFSATDADHIVGALMALSGLFVGMLAQQLPMLALFARSRYGAVGLVAAVGTGVHVAASAVALSLDGIVWLGVAASLSSLVTMGLMLWLVHGRGVGRALVTVVRETALVGAAAGVAFGPLAVLAALLGAGLWDFAAAAIGCIAFAFVLRAALPEHAAVGLRMLAPLLPTPARPTAA